MLNLKFYLKNILENRWFPYIFFVVLIFAVYAPALNFGFTYLDDNTLILDNYHFISNVGNFFEAFKNDVFHTFGSDAFYYRPFLTIYLMVGAALSGLNPAGYHFLNILVHLAAVFLLFVFLQKLEFGRNAAFFASLIFAVHPVLTQAVVWIPGANDSLAAVFVLASFIFFVDYFNSRKWPHLAWHLIFWLAAIFTKETAIFAPILFCLYLFLQRKAIFTGDKNKALSIFLFSVIGWLALFIFWFLLRYQALGGRVLGISVGSAVVSVFKNLPSVFLYVGKVLFPVNLSVFPFLQDQTFVYGFVVAGILAVLLYLNRKSVNWKNVIFGVAWFIVFLVPSLLRPNLQIVPDLLEHRIYLPIMGFIIVFLEIKWEKIGEWMSCFIKISPHKISTAFLFSLIFILALTTIFYSRNFEDKISFWTNAVKNSPHAPLAHRNLGAMYWLDGKVDEAKTEYEKALELNVTEPMAHNNLGLIAAKKGDYNGAIKEYQTELSINPYYDNALFNLGIAYWELSKKSDAAKQWQETIAVNPDYLDAYRALIIYYQEKGDSKTAESYYSTLQKLSQ